MLLAFSGGTDSCYSAVKLVGEGYMVEALVMDMTGDSQFIGNAVSKANALGIPCRTVDVRESFRRDIMDYFAEGYLSGRTPAPCTVCNALIKWKTLYDTATGEGFDHIATGHYFRTVILGGHYHVAKARDRAKDQSYYLWMLPQEILSMALTPMGGEIKKEVVARGLSPLERESMGVCFLGGKDYREFIRERHGDHPSCQPGDIVDRERQVLGLHDGCAFYTVGQKKGLPPGYAVTGIDAADNRLRAGNRDELMFRHIILDKYILADTEKQTGNISEVKLRGYGQNPEGGCSFRREGENLILTFPLPVWAPAKGQPAVFYDGDLVTGGGFVCGYY